MTVTIYSTSESVIFAALRNGDMRRAVELLLDTFQDEVYGYCARLVGLIHAGDVYHRVLSAAIDDLQSLQAQTSLRAWLYGIARKVVAHHHRGDLRLYPDALRPDYVPVSGPVDTRDVCLQDELVEQYIGTLDPPLQEVLHLSLWYGLRLSEVAYVTGRTIDDVRSMAAAGLTHVALCLQRGDNPS